MHVGRLRWWRVISLVMWSGSLAVVRAGAQAGSPAAAASGSSMPHDSAPPRHVALHGTVIVPLLHANARDRRPEVMVLVNGKGPYRFAVETGAREINVSHQLAANLGLVRTAGTPDDPEYHLDRIEVGSARFDGMMVEEMPPGVQGVDGVLGLPFFQDVLVTIDYPAERLLLSRGSVARPNGKDILPLVRIAEYWGLPIVLGGKPFDAVLDTQNSGALNLPPVVADQLTFDGGLQLIGHARGAFSTTDVKGGLLAGDLTIGQYRFPAPFIDVIELPADFPRRPNVGSALLGNFVVTLDQRHARLQLAHAGGTEIDLPRPARRPAAAHGG